MSPVDRTDLQDVSLLDILINRALDNSNSFFRRCDANDCVNTVDSGVVTRILTVPCLISEFGPWVACVSALNQSGHNFLFWAGSG